VRKNGFIKILLVLTIIIILFGVVISYWFFPEGNEDFKNGLKGEIVFVHRDNNILNVYKISANGSNKKLIYHSEENFNSNSLFPTWSDDGLNIYFTAMRTAEWRKFSTDTDGKNVVIINNNPGRLSSRYSSSDDIYVEKGNLYYKDVNDIEKKVYSFMFYNPDLNSGASEASWSPDKNYIIFQSCKFLKGCSIFIANKEGITAEITKGEAPDWKF
jgi:Tol biopolymer transport system component